VSIGRATLTVGGLTALSRVAGFVRDLLIAAALGAGPVADAFFVSLKLANFLRRLFAEGAFSAAFIPLYGRLGDAEGARRARRFAGEVLAVLAAALLLVVLLGELLMPWLVRVIAAGFAPGSLSYRLSVELGRLTFPYILFISLAALFSGMLQAGHRFAAAAFAPVLLNLVLIVVLLASGAVGAPAARLLAWGVAAAGLLQLGWVAAAAWRAGLAPLPARPRLSPEVKRLLALIGPGVLGIGVVQVNLLVSSWFATHLAAGTVAYLFYADRLVQLPLGIVGVALGTALLPSLSRAVRHQGRMAHDVLNRAIELALLLGLPAAVGLGLLARPIIAVLFERGAFKPEATTATAEVLAGLALGLPAYILTKVLAPGFFAIEDTRTPVRVAFVALAVNAVAALLLAGPLAHLGIALAISLSSWVNALGLAVLLKHRGVLVPDSAFKRRAGGTVAAVAIMTMVLLAGRAGLGGEGAATLVLLIAAGGGSFLLAAWGVGAVDRRALRQLWSPSRA
jgi:putative peptidoglycan lipid II flippase